MKTKVMTRAAAFNQRPQKIRILPIAGLYFGHVVASATQPPDRLPTINAGEWNGPMKPTKAVNDIKAKLIARVLQSVEGLSVRHAEAVTGMNYQSISRMRRGSGGSHLEELIKAALTAGVTVDVNIGQPHRKVRDDGCRDTFRPKRRRRPKPEAG